MTKFMRKRLEYFKRAALSGDTVRLGKEDAELFEKILFGVIVNDILVL